MSQTHPFAHIAAPPRRMIGVGLLLALATVCNARADTPVTGGSASAEVTVFEIMAEDAETLTFSAQNRQLWIYGRQRLQAFHRDGRTLLDRKLPQLPATHRAVDMLVGNDTVWLAIGNELYRINLEGQLVAERRFRGTIRAIHYDAHTSRVLVTTPGHVIVLDRQGREIKRIRTRLPHIA